ncbi:hypothetical protein CC86DRAFT_278926 [Ophiobolus disseminans]|uniref:Uncharacterized protein n=1 Tax=Ophiobolus disseminans TaxID=1469910 RepID=A0A6A7AKN4_9PLEO|nr:hypothetical protein CC86DRAFT_278926 [Ophiobolus disseminans]
MHHHHVRRSEHVAASTAGSHTLVDRASRVLVARSTCTSDSQPGCTKPTQVPTLAIVLAVVVPIVALMIVLFFLHRRNKRKLAEEDAKDRNSLDFGMEPKRTGKKGIPEMSITEKEIRGGGRDRGLSLEGGSPYILPVGLHGSRESFHSLSRSHNDPHDPYRPVTFLNDGQSVRSQSRAYGHDNGSLYTTSSGGTQRNRMNDGLLKNAQRMSTSHPMRGESLSPDGSRSPDVKFPDSAIALSPLNPRSDNGPPLARPAELPERHTPKPMGIPVITVPEPAAREVKSTSPIQAPALPSYPPRIQSQTAVVLENANHNSILSTSSYGDAFQVTPPSPPRNQTAGAPAPVAPQPRRPVSGTNDGLGIDEFGQHSNRLSIMRPLPPDDVEENPALRAERIRSFYKEYFDDSKPEPVGGHNYTDYYEDYGSEYHQEGPVYDTRSRGFVAAQPNAPFAAPVTRRAMTPPPRAPPRFRSNTQTGPGPRGAHMSNSSMASSQYPPRNMSSMSSRGPPPGPRKPLPPPSALSSLPTPAKLTEDSMVFNPIDFAPPVSFRDRQNGLRPDSPLGSPRPFSPSVRPHTPLVSAYDDIAVLPSPHLLRKSGTFTSLDFAPPPKFRDPGSNGSDAGSIRSNRSGMSAAGRYAVANGANRVSKIPKEMVFTRDDMMNQLRPKLNMVEKA